MCVCGALLFILFCQNSIHRGKIWSSDINHFRKVKTAWDLCAWDMHASIHVIISPSFIGLHIYLSALPVGPLSPPPRGKFNIELSKHTLLGKAKLNFLRLFSSYLFRRSNDSDEVTSTVGLYYSCQFILM